MLAMVYDKTLGGIIETTNIKSGEIHKQQQNCKLLHVTGDWLHFQAAKMTRPLAAQPNLMLLKFTVEPVLGSISPLGYAAQSPNWINHSCISSGFFAC